MKNLLISIIALLAGNSMLYGQSANKAFQLRGTVLQNPKDSVSISYQNGIDAKSIHRTLPVVNGTFTLEGHIYGPTSARIVFKNKGEVKTDEVLQRAAHEFYIDPGMMTMTVDPDDLGKLKITGSKTQLDLEAYNEMMRPVQDQLNTLKAAIKKETDPDKKSALKKQQEPLYTAITNKTYDFFIGHPNSFVTESMLQLYGMMFSEDSTKRVFNALPDELKQNRIGKTMAERFAANESVANGKMVKNFKTVDVNQKPLSLDQFKGKYLILDFWASWCVPCRKSHPALRKIYAKYHSKGLEIVGIADDGPRPAVWREAIAKDSIGVWHHVLDGADALKTQNGIKNPDDIMALYGVTALPTKFLVDPNGRIIMKEIGDDMTAMANKLAELIK